MRLFEANREEIIKSRSSFIKDLSNELNGQYYYGIDSIKSNFNIVSYSEIENSNVIVGNKEGYDYCFIEYYHFGKGKYDRSSLRSFVKIKLHYSFPDFEILTKDSAKRKVGCFLFGAILSFIIFFPSLIPLFEMLLNIVRGKSIDIASSIGIILISFIFFCIFLGIIFYLITKVFKTMKQIINQGKYNISNRKFSEKYVILTNSEAYNIRRFFTDKVCSKIVSAIPEINEIRVKNSCIESNMNYNEGLSYEHCSKYLNILLRKANIIESENR